MVSRRKTKCLTYGQTHTQGFPLTENGKVIGRICVDVYLTLCGKDVDYDECDLPPDSPAIDPLKDKRLLGYCPSCWRQWREDCQRTLDGEPCTPAQ